MRSLPQTEEASVGGALVIATSAALATLAPVVAYQLGLLKRLPDPPGAIFDSEKIATSKAARPLGIPDGILGMGSYGATLALALLMRKHPEARKLLALKLVGDASLAGFNLVRQVVLFGRLCSWCTGTAICTAAMIVAGRKIVAQEATSASAAMVASWR